MIIVSSREFRDRQKDYLDKVDEGEEILIQRGKDKAYKIVPITQDDTLITKKEFFEKIDRAIQSIKDGKGKTITGQEELTAYLPR